MRLFLKGLLLLSLSACQSESHQESKEAPILKTPSTESNDTIAPPLPHLDMRKLWALARSRQEEDQNHLQRLLTTTSPSRNWAAFGLGLSCAEFKNAQSLHFLVNAVASWASDEKAPDEGLLQTAGRAIGACATEEAEEVLRSWLSPNPSSGMENLIDAGSFGLASLVDRRNRLSERTQTALLDAASRENRAELLLPLGRLHRLSEAVGSRMLEVAGSLLTGKRSIGRRHAIFALGSAGPSATAPLSQVLLAKAFTPQERAAAAQALGRLGEPGQKALDRTLARLLERGLPKTFDNPLWIPLRAALTALDSPQLSRAGLSKLRGVVLSEGAERDKRAQRRRLVWLRCRAADLLAGDRYESVALLECGPRSKREASLARLRSVARAPFKAKRLSTYLSYLEDSDPAIYQAALRLLPAHPEVPLTSKILHKALESASPGTQATAAHIIAAYPSRMIPEDENAEDFEDLLGALLTLLEERSPPVPDETRAAAIQAAGALQALSLKPLIEKLCHGKSPALHAQAESALALLGSPEKKCGAPQIAALSPSPSKKNHAEPPVTLQIDSDVGELWLYLDSPSAPDSRKHFLKLVEEGFYDGIEVHGSRPGFAVQFGDKNGDGYDEDFSEALPHEVSPTPFTPLSFGMSAFSPGAQNSQIFVVVSDAPQLTGTRVRLGDAEGPWHLLTVGDVLHSLRRVHGTRNPQK